MKIVFFGTPHFAAHVLHYLLEHGVNVVAVITKPDRPQGRSGTPVATPVKIEALSRVPELPVYQPDIVSSPDFAPILESYQADLFLVVAYGEILKQHLLDMPKVACLNLHASLLPKYRGAAPIQRSIMNGETESGVTVMHMVKKMDAGDIISTANVPIGPNMTAGELESQLCQTGSELLFKTVQEIENGHSQRTAQDPTLVTMAPKIELEDCQIDWQQPAQTIHNLVRGVNPFPGAWCQIEVRGQPKRLRILKTELESNIIGRPAQILSASPKELVIGCGVGALRLLQVQLEGKKVMSVEEFMRGFPSGALLF